ncbi:MAG: adenosylmethionine decarboxylase [Candidatus Micrarchaeia archaeon]
MAIQKTTQILGRSCPRVIGKHVYGNMHGLDPALLVDAERLEDIVRGAAKTGKMHLIEIMKYQFSNKESPDYGGVSIIALIAESHIALHTWPESNYATIDIYSCGEDSDPKMAFNYIIGEMKPVSYKQHYADRSN